MNILKTILQFIAQYGGMIPGAPSWVVAIAAAGEAGIEAVVEALKDRITNGEPMTIEEFEAILVTPPDKPVDTTEG